MTARRYRKWLATVLSVLAAAGLAVVARSADLIPKNHVVAYFQNSNGVFVGDEVRILGVPVGKIERIEPQPESVKVSFWFDRRHPVPAGANAVVISPSLVTARAIQLTPAYTGGATLGDDSVIPQRRTAVPVEWDDLRQQLEKLTTSLRPAEPGGLSTLGSFIHSSADNLRGQGANIHAALIQLSETLSALGDHSADIFGTVRNVSTLVTALRDSTVLMRQLNGNLAAVTGLLANNPVEVGQALDDLNSAVSAVAEFVAKNRDGLTMTTGKLTSITTAVNDSLDDVKQTLHVAPNTFANFLNAFEPAQGAFTADPAINNFGDPISFICGAIQAASRMGAEQAAKLCVQYLAPIVKNRQYNFPPVGLNPIVGAIARPNEVTYSEDWLRPDYVPPATTAGQTGGRPEPEQSPSTDSSPPPLPAEAKPTDPALGLPGLMVAPPGPP